MVDSKSQLQKNLLVTPIYEAVHLPPDAAIGSSDCPRCLGIGYVTTKEFGKVESCECRREEIADARQAQTHLLQHEKEMTFDVLYERGDCTREMLSAVKEFAKKPFGMLTLWGGPGTGKSASLIALVNHIAREQDAVYIRFKDLLDYVRAGNAPTASDDAYARYEQMRDVYFLAIDEMDKVRTTDYAFEFRTAFFDDRYRFARDKSCHTVVAMNCDPTTLPDHIYDRLRWGEREEGGFRIIANHDSSARPSGL